tara:strand:- start:829 stop:1083 length:255 start_codon:yes stop_codon:yes gene_type:complete
MINQKKEKNKINKLILVIIISFITLSSFAIAEQCKTFDIACKTSNFINKSKDYQKKKFEESNTKIKEQIKDVTNTVQEKLPIIK